MVTLHSRQSNFSSHVITNHLMSWWLFIYSFLPSFISFRSFLHSFHPSFLHFFFNFRSFLNLFICLCIHSYFLANSFSYSIIHWSIQPIHSFILLHFYINSVHPWFDIFLLFIHLFIPSLNSFLSYIYLFIPFFFNIPFS